MKRTSELGKIPSVDNVRPGELAINLNDRTIYTKDHQGSIVKLGGTDINLVDASTDGTSVVENATGTLRTIVGSDTIEVTNDSGTIKLDTKYIAGKNVTFTTDEHGYVSINGTTDVKVAPDSGIIINESGELALNVDLISTIGFKPTRVLYVATNGNWITGTGSYSNPFASISQALDVAEEKTAIYVFPGEYQDTLTIGNKQLAIIGVPGPTNGPMVNLKGFVQQNGTSPCYVDNIGIDHEGTGGYLRITHNTGSVFNNIHFNTNSTKAAIEITSGGYGSGTLAFTNMHVPAGRIYVGEGVTGNIIFDGMDMSSIAIIEVNAANVVVKNINQLLRIDHFGGNLKIHNVQQIGQSAYAAALISTADTGLLAIDQMNTWVNSSTQSYINKTGICNYIVTSLTRNVTKDVWTGNRIYNQRYFDVDSIITHTGTQYTGIVGQTLDQHLKGIDAALGNRLSNINDVGTTGISLIKTANTGTLKRLQAGTGIDIANVGDLITITNTNSGVSTLNDQTGNVSIVGLGATIVSTNNGTITISTEGSENIVTGVNGVSGNINIKSGDNVTIDTDVDTGDIVINATGGSVIPTGITSVESDQSVGTSLVNSTGAGSGIAVIKTINSGNGIDIEDVDGIVTLTNAGILSVSDDASPDGMSLITTSGQDIKLKMLQSGSGVSLVDENNIITINMDSSSGTVLSVNGIKPDVNGDVEISTDFFNALMLAGGTMEGDINMNNNYIDGLPEPTSPHQPVTLDTLVGVNIDNGYF